MPEPTSVGPDSGDLPAGPTSTAAQGQESPTVICGHDYAPADKGPYLIIAAFWQEDDNTDAVAEALRQESFPRPPGYSAGVVVAFRHEVADSHGFRRDLSHFDLDELNERPE